MYEQILGIGSPWKVERVELKQDEGAVHIYVEHKDDSDRRRGLVMTVALAGYVMEARGYPVSPLLGPMVEDHFRAGAPYRPLGGAGVGDGHDPSV